MNQNERNFDALIKTAEEMSKNDEFAKLAAAFAEVKTEVEAPFFEKVAELAGQIATEGTVAAMAGTFEKIAERLDSIENKLTKLAESALSGTNESSAAKPATAASEESHMDDPDSNTEKPVITQEEIRGATSEIVKDPNRNTAESAGQLVQAVAQTNGPEHVAPAAGTIKETLRQEESKGAISKEEAAAAAAKVDEVASAVSGE
ncbi:MAG: hypothetical protein SVK08_01830 [Halobacteriota archaeon]|nr:hypothetical protein [Halobacteriota archaeon]